jgi:CDP-glycerol glycerophosphotransferase (TagB/SpsB family)
MLNIKKLTNYIFDNYIVVDKLAFYINEEYIFDHYHNVMMKLNNDSFDVILNDKFRDEQYTDLIKGLKSYSWNVKFLSEALYVNKYEVLITHLYLGGHILEKGNIMSRLFNVFVWSFDRLFFGLNKKKGLQYMQKILGNYNIRFMYGADAGGVKFGDYNQLFDLFFCHGPRDSNIIKDKFKKPVFEMGYPRYDNYFNNLGNTVFLYKLLEKYSCNQNKKTILWICTVSEYFSTIETYAEAMGKLTEKFNVILRPHPLEIDPQYSRYNQRVDTIVNSNVFIVNDNPYQDMTELYLISDYVFCDYGGSIFSALYNDMNILLLNHKNVYMDSGVYESTSMEARNYLPSVNEESAGDIDNILSSKLFWSSRLSKKKKARELYFGKKIGLSSVRVAEKLKEFL